MTIPPGQAEQALGAIKETSRDALRELRGTLGVLRGVDEAAPTAPAHGLSQLSRLVDQAAAAGLVVRTEIDGEQADATAVVTSGRRERLPRHAA